MIFATHFHTCLFAGAIVLFGQLSLAWGDCWTTGCQPSDWAVVGCDQYERSEQGSEACQDGRGVSGFKYTCCSADSDDQAFEDGDGIGNLYRNGKRFGVAEDAYGEQNEDQQLWDENGQGEDSNQDW